MYVVYILQSDLDGSYYIGQTENLERRLTYHNSGKSRYTSRKLPWKVVYDEAYKTRKEAIHRERFLKNQRNRKFYEALIKNYRSLNQGDSNKI
ncbi:GIY-YIG nuclease family protein [Ulvibacterium sp.]|uniref:GIY-YIG nuclease family protein n=1 Tax=Ulvibacterium sp. TaxID=2665914 RepID=UPI002622FB7B|nr:GIY-YIG nuclease family protein [Ulvibacterium sp.]